MPRKKGKNSRAKGDGTVFQRNGKWYAQLTVGRKDDGSYHRVTRTAKNKTDANNILAELRLQHHTGKLTVKGDTKFSVFVAEWLNNKKSSIKPLTFMNYADIVRINLLPEFGNLSLNKITMATVDDFLAKEQKKYSPAAVKKHRAILHGIMERAVKEEIIPRNPVYGSDRIKKTQSTRKVISPEDVTKIFDATRELFESNTQHAGQTFFAYPILMTAYCTGMRIGEIFDLRWRNVDLENRVIKVRDNLTEARDDDGKMKLMVVAPKTVESTRDIDISDDLCAVLRRIKPLDVQPDADIVFHTKNGGYIAPSNFARVWRKLLKELGMSGRYVLYEYRHTHASLLRAAGIDDLSIAQRMGHSSATTTQRFWLYSNPSGNAIITYG